MHIQLLPHLEWAPLEQFLQLAPTNTICSPYDSKLSGATQKDENLRILSFDDPVFVWMNMYNKEENLSIKFCTYNLTATFL